MRVLPIHVIPIFLGQTLPYEEVGAQVRYFDVYYTTPPAIGFHVIGCDTQDSGVTGFQVVGQKEDNGAEVQGFTVDCPDKSSLIKGFTVDSNSDQDTCYSDIVGFHIEDRPEEVPVIGFGVEHEPAPENVQGFSVTCEDKEDNGVTGFIVEDV